MLVDNHHFERAFLLAPSRLSRLDVLSFPADLKAPGDAAVGDRTTCPISGETFVVTANSPKVEFEGKTYFMCCPGCEEKFKADPQKYLTKA
jgi:YHS domain-containing protein